MNKNMYNHNLIKKYYRIKCFITFNLNSIDATIVLAPTNVEGFTSGEQEIPSFNETNANQPEEVSSTGETEEEMAGKETEKGMDKD